MKTPIRIEDVADVEIGNRLRTGAATENGRGSCIGNRIYVDGVKTAVKSHLAVSKKN